ncbi:hypothetical protein C1893_21355 [Pseudomonas sp. MPR-ANC1]|uniref:hypothetical protein n=1 Tax=Pseudomonas sp. MPR-ANC1 TaxID=2075548 RepID=UPI000CD29CDC|nr:hypothetical protein [Pseudomonas sp. MPR-ANC1]POA46327.1 hypothetical protein C1893_21355 [Pseudomonas sp. MPR-ANC1]
MAKIDTTSTEVQTSSEPALSSSPFSSPESLKFRDKLYTSRLLIVPGIDRSYPVDKATVVVPASDIEAVKFLKASEEYEPFKE